MTSNQSSDRNPGRAGTCRPKIASPIAQRKLAHAASECTSPRRRRASMAPPPQCVRPRPPLASRHVSNAKARSGLRSARPSQGSAHGQPPLIPPAIHPSFSFDSSQRNVGSSNHVDGASTIWFPRRLTLKPPLSIAATRSRRSTVLESVALCASRSTTATSHVHPAPTNLARLHLRMHDLTNSTVCNLLLR